MKKRPSIDSASWMPAEYIEADVVALKALQAGTADADQQKRVLDWIINKACATYDFPYRPVSDRDTNLALGRMFVGQQIVKLLNMNVSLLRRNNG